MAAEEEDKEAAAMSALKSVHRRRSKSAELILERSVLRWSLVVVVRGCVCVVCAFLSNFLLFSSSPSLLPESIHMP